MQNSAGNSGFFTFKDYPKFLDAPSDFENISGLTDVTMQADVDLPLEGDDVNITVKKTETCASKSKDSETTYIS